jgi:hypothetical protein
MTTVNWSEVPSGTYERMVAVLISTLNPDAERIDGAGGDGGRDVQLRGGGRLVLWELKSQSGRVGPTQRRQIERSLERAAKLNPDSWTLAIPIDPTPAELKWFDTLQSRYPFTLKWLGRSWLDGQMAERAYLPRYFVYGGADEATKLLLELRKDEQEFGRGISHVVSRVEGWVKRLRELDPFWDFQISRSTAGAYSITPVPKYRGAERDRPIRISLEGRFPNTDEGRNARDALQMAIEYGRPATIAQAYVQTVEVDAPAVLDGAFDGDVSIAGMPDTTAKPGLVMIVYAPDGSVVSALPLTVSETTHGIAGTELTFVDYSGGLTLRMRATQPNAPLHTDFHFLMPASVLPSQVSPTLRLLGSLHKPNRVAFRVVGSDHDAAGAPDVHVDAPIPQGLVEVIDALARIQDLTHIYFPVPDTITRESAAKVIEVDKLLSGTQVEMRWEQVAMTIVVPADPQPLASGLVDVDAAQLQYVGDREEDLFGYKIPIRDVAIELDSARIANRAELEGQLPLQPGVELQVNLVPASTDAGRLKVVQKPMS